MTAVLRKIFMILIGLTAGIAAWAAIEILLYFSESIGRHILWNGLAGASIGVLFGFFFGSAEGIMFSDPGRSVRGGITGGAFGLVGGTGAVILAQGVLYWMGNAELFANSVSNSLIVPLSRALGWGLLGLIIGAVDGIRSGSVKRTGIGISGGVLGGLIGGLLLEFLTRFWSNGFFARGVGLAVMGFGIGLFFTLFEYSSAYGRVRVLTGPMRGKEYVLVMNRTKIGSSLRANIPLSNYRGVEKNHAVLTADREGVSIQAVKGTVLVNEQSVKKQELKFEDVIHLGDARLFYLPR